MPRTNILATRPVQPFPRWADWPELELFTDFVRAAHSETLRVETYVDGGRLVIRAELPGIDPDKDVEISISGGMLHIFATREEKVEYKGKDEFRSEFRYGSFSRSVALPEGADEHDVKATYNDGILEVRLPITATATRKIAVEHG